MTGGALAFALLTATSSASGQVVAPSRVTPTTLAPPSGPSGAIVVTSPEGLTAPANASKLFLTIGNVTVEGGFPELAADTAAITAKIQGRRISVAEIFAAANAIEQAYAARGYVLVRVAVPPQQLKNGGSLRLVVIDGFIEGVDLKGIPEKQRALVQARLASLIGKRHVTLAEIERRLLLASDIPGLSLSSTITRGTAPGGTLLVLEGTWNAVVATLGVRQPAADLARRLGAQRGAGAEQSAWLRRADLRRRVLRLGPRQGLQRDDADAAARRRNCGADRRRRVEDQSGIHQLGDAARPDAVGAGGRRLLSALRPARELSGDLSRAQTLTFQVTYEWAQEHLSPIGFDTDLYDDQYNVARLQLEDHLRLPYGLLAGTLVFSQGLGGRGDTQAALTGVPLSQQGAFPTFSKLGLDATWTQPLPYDLQGALIGQAQTSFGHPLFVAEQFSLDGSQAASAYRWARSASTRE